MASEEKTCALCGLALPRTAVTDSDGARFCCAGCAHVAAILRALGAESEAGRLRLAAAQQHGLLSAPALEARPASSIQHSKSIIQNFTSAASSTQNSEFKIQNSTLPSDRREELRFRIEGLVCPSCAWLAETLLERHPGVWAVEVDFLSDTARVVFDLRRTSRDEIRRALASAGYGMAAINEERGPEERRELLRLAFAAAVACNLMMMAWVGYDAFLSGAREPQARVLAWFAFLFALPVATWAALPLYRRALAAFWQGRVVMESLVSLGIVASFLLSLGSLLAGGIHVYLETATALVAISLGGRALERWLKRRAARSLTGVLRFGPTKARRAQDGRFAPLNEFPPGAQIAVEAGEVVPLDVRLAPESGASKSSATSAIIVRESLLTGESQPVTRRAGDLVLAGSTLEKGRLIGVVEHAAGHAVADAIAARVREALHRCDEATRLADRLAQGFVPLVLLIAAAAFAAHWMHGDGAATAAFAAVAVLVVACPCAFGIAASSALSLATLRLAQRGVLVKSPASLEALRAIDAVIFDKTGTLTRGELALRETGWLGDRDPSLLVAVHALERHSSHPIGISLARALREEPGAARTDDPTIEGAIETPGLGITGTIAGRRLAVGSPKLFATIPAPQNPQFAIRNPQSLTRVWFGWAGEPPRGWFDLADALRPGAAEFVRACAARGLSIALYSGDAPETTRAIAAAAGIPAAFGGLTPQEKAGRVRALRASGKRVLYIGDGFNDAEALAAADVGIALAAGADLAMLSAPIVVSNQDLGILTRLLETARQTARVIRGNFLWAFVYNFALLPVAALGYLAPIYAAALMALSSASVALNSLRAGRIARTRIQAVRPAESATGIGPAPREAPFTFTSTGTFTEEV